MKLITLFTAIGFLIFGNHLLWADSTSLPVSFYLVDSTGTPLDGAKTITVRLYAAATGGSALWSEERSITCDAGVCSTTLGADDSNPVSAIVASSSQLFLTIQVSGENESDERVELSAVPWAMVANSLASGVVTSTSIASSAVTSGAIASDAVTSSKIASGAVAASNIADSAVATAKVADSAITTTKISDGTIATADLADSSVTAAKVTDDALDFSDFADLLTLDANLTLSQGSSTWTQSFTGTTGDAINLTVSSLTTGNALEITGPSGSSVGVTDSLLKLTSDANTSGSVLRSTATIDTTAASSVASNVRLLTTNSNSSTTNVVHGIYNQVVDTTTMANQDIGILTLVDHSGASASGKTVVGAYILAQASSATGGVTDVRGVDVNTTATHGSDAGTVNQYGVYVNNNGGEVNTNGTSTKYGIYVDPLTGADNNYPIIAVPPEVETIGVAGTITANACGTVKIITSILGVTTDTTNTFTAPATANAGCCMDIVNNGTNSITLDNNNNFRTSLSGDVTLMGQYDAVRVCSTGTYWFQVSTVINNG